jgi:hypothetical protein
MTYTAVLCFLYWRGESITSSREGAGIARKAAFLRIGRFLAL